MFGGVVYECFRFCRGGFLGGEAPAGECAGADMFRAVSIAADFSTNDRNDKAVRGLLTAKPSVGRDALVPPHNVHSWFRFAPALLYNVISTGVRTIVRTQRRNPPRKKCFIRVRDLLKLPIGVLSHSDRRGVGLGNRRGRVSRRTYRRLYER